MRVLFCNIAWMKYYNGITEYDKPENGGSWVKENENAIECLNLAMMEVIVVMYLLSQIEERAINYT